MPYGGKFAAQLNHSAVQLLDELTDSWAGAIEFVEESDDEIAQALREGHLERLRYANSDRVPFLVRTAAAAIGKYIADESVLSNGRVELLWYFQEQSLTHMYHRYGNLGARTEEVRAEVL